MYQFDFFSRYNSNRTPSSGNLVLPQTQDQTVDDGNFFFQKDGEYFNVYDGAKYLIDNNIYKSGIIREEEDLLIGESNEQFGETGDIRGTEGREPKETEKTKESDEGDWLTRRGFIAWKSGWKTDKVNRDIREKVHEHFRKNYLKEIVELGKELEEEALIEWSDPNSTMATNYNKAEDWLQASTAEQVHQLLRNGIILSKNEVLSDMDIEDSDLFKLQERMRK